VIRGELVAELAATLGARHEARFIVEEVLGRDPASPDQVAGSADIDTARALAARRRCGEPLQYVLGHWAFRTLDLWVDPRVLIPRPETEQVVEVALGELRRLAVTAPVIVDAGTGSGAIALSLAAELAPSHPGGRLWATEASAGALAVATANLERVACERAAGKQAAGLLPVRFLQGSWLSSLPSDLKGAVDLVVSNPPYVARSEWEGLPADVRREPREALVAADGAAGTPGLADVEEVLSQSWLWLGRPGTAVIEVAPHQAAAATAAARAAGFTDVRVEPDLAGRPRALVARAR
jgi:release factor glutamine methyltransferase